MKKLAIAALTVVAVMTLSACGPQPGVMNPIKDKTTAVEYSLIEDFNRQTLSIDEYELLYAKVKGRTAAPSEDEYPFCEEIRFLTPDSGYHSHYDIHDQVLKFYPDIKRVCPKSGRLSHAADVPTPIEKDAKTFETVSSETLKELGYVAKDCNSAKVLITVENALYNISQERAEELIKKCHWDKLQEELNK